MKFGRRAESPIDDQLAEADIQDRMALASALRQKSMQGGELDNVGGHLIGSPWARALSSVAQGVQGAGERKRAYSMAGDLATSKRERLAQALGGAGQEPTPEARLKRGMELMGHPDPQAQAVGQYMAESAQKEIQQAAEAQQKQYGETNKDLRHMQDLYQRDQAATRQTEAAAEAAKGRNAATIEAARIRASAGGGGADPYFTYQPITDENGAITGIAKLDARGGPAARVEVPGLGFVQRPQDNPALQEDLSRGRGRGGVVGKEEGAAVANLADREAALPRLEEMTSKLEGLAEKATYTAAGQLRDSIARQLGADVPEAGVARAEYETTVANEMLPLLRQTFGPQFTAEEGQRLTRTLGDINLSPAEKNAAIRAFIDAQRGAIATGQRRVDAMPQQSGAPAPTTPAADPLGLFN